MSRRDDDIPVGAIIGVVIALIFILGGGIYGCAACKSIPPGHVGVSIKKCDGGGVDKTPIPTGYYRKSVFCEEIEIYPTSLQTLILTKSASEGSQTDDSITVTSNEGMPINVDVSISFTLEPNKVPAIYEKYRSDIEHIMHTYVRQTVREGMQATFSQFTAEQLYAEKKEVARAQAQDYITKKLSPEGFVIVQFTINELRVPDQVRNAINAKVAMIQEAQKAEQEVRKTKALAQQREAQAEGEASAMRTKADAEAYANETIAKSITPELVQYKALDRWNGFLPQFTGGGPIPFIQVK